MPTTSPKWGIPTAQGSDVASTIDNTWADMTSHLDSVMAAYYEGPFSSRPVSTPGSPGKSGRLYRATDTGRLYQDHGTGWNELDVSPAPHKGKSIIATEEARTNTAYGLMATPDRVSGIVLPTDGLILIGYHAVWQQSVASAARAAIFIGANQLQLASATGIAVQEASIGATTAQNYPLVGSMSGLIVPSSGSGGYTTPVTTGQILGVSTGGGFVVVFAAAGTYDVSVQFKASSGSVTAKNRKLWVWTMAF